MRTAKRVLLLMLVLSLTMGGLCLDASASTMRSVALDYPAVAMTPGDSFYIPLPSRVKFAWEVLGDQSVIRTNGQSTGRLIVTADNYGVCILTGKVIESEVATRYPVGKTYNCTVSVRKPKQLVKNVKITNAGKRGVVILDPVSNNTFTPKVTITPKNAKDTMLYWTLMNYTGPSASVDSISGTVVAKQADYRSFSLSGISPTGKAGSCVLYILPVSRVDIPENKIKIKKDETRSISANVSGDPNYPIIWEISKPGIVEIISQDNHSILIRGVKKGTATISASTTDYSRFPYSNLKDSLKITVK